MDEKISLNLEADSINVMALNMGKIAVEVDGVELAELVDVLNENGWVLRIADEPGEVLPATARISGIQCSTAHIAQEDSSV